MATEYNAVSIEQYNVKKSNICFDVQRSFDSISFYAFKNPYDYYEHGIEDSFTVNSRHFITFLCKLYNNL
jgi:hypothetical protein